MNSHIKLIGVLHMGKALTNTAKILKLLKTKGSATNRELNTVGGFRYGARLHELRQEGHIIVTERVHEGLYRFIYKGEDGDTDEYEVAA